MLEKEQNKREQRCRYNIAQWKVKGRYEIINDTSENFTLVQLMYTVGNVNNAAIIVGYWIFYPNYKIHFR